MLPNDYEKIKGVVSIGGAKTGKLYVDQGGEKKSVMTIKNGEGDTVFDKCAWLIQDGHIREGYSQAYIVSEDSAWPVERKTAISKSVFWGKENEKEIGYLAFGGTKSSISANKNAAFMDYRHDVLAFDNDFIEGETCCLVAEVYSNGDQVGWSSGSLVASIPLSLSSVTEGEGAYSDSGVSRQLLVNSPATTGNESDRTLFIVGAGMVVSDDGEFIGYTPNLTNEYNSQKLGRLHLRENSHVGLAGFLTNYSSKTAAKNAYLYCNIVNLCLIPTRLLPQMVARLGWNGLEQYIDAVRLTKAEDDAINALYE